MNAIDQLLLKNDDNEIRGETLKINRSFRLDITKINAGSVLLPIVLFEILVCILGSQFYLSIGYKAYSAIILAITIEVFYMYFSSRRDMKSTFIKLVLLGISVTTLSYSAYIKDKNVINSNKLIQSELSDSESRLLEVNNELSLLKNEKLQIEKDMELFREYKKATKGNQILAPRRKELQERRKDLLGERKVLKADIHRFGNKLVNQSIFSNLNILSIQTLISILAFTIVQIAICIALPDILERLKE